MNSVSVTTIARDGQVLQSQAAEVSSLGQAVGSVRSGGKPGAVHCVGLDVRVRS